MSLTHAEFSALVPELQSKLVSADFVDSFQEGERKIYLSFQRSTLLLCLQEPFLRFNLATQKIKHEQGAFSRVLFFHLRNSRLIQVEQILNDRILLLTFQKGKERYQLIGEFFPKRPNLYLTDESGKVIGSVNKSNFEHYTPIGSNPGIFRMGPNPSLNPMGVYQYPLARNQASSGIHSVTHGEIELRYLALEKEAFFQKEKHLLYREIKEKRKRCLRTIEKCSEELKYLSEWETVQHEGELLQANLYRLKKGMVSIVVQDWSQEGAEREIALDVNQNPTERVSVLFRKAKKMRGGIERCTTLISQTSEALKNWEKGLQEVEEALNLEELERIRQGLNLFTPLKKEHKAVPFYEFLSESGLKIWVGKGAKENEKLTFSIAKGSDFWLHVRDFPGAHVVIQVSKGHRPDEESIKDALQLALAYSQGKDKGVVDILMTQCKFVSRFGKKKGQVSISTHGIFQEQFNPERFQRIKKRKMSL